MTKSRRPSIYRRGGRFSPLHQFTVSGGRDLQCKIRGEPSRLVISPRIYSAERYRPRRDRPISSRPRLEIRGPGDLTGATQLVKESDSKPRRTFYTPPPLPLSRLESRRDRGLSASPRRDNAYTASRIEEFLDPLIRQLAPDSRSFFDGKII